MEYLLDTDTTSYLIKRKCPQHKKVLKRLLSLQPEKIAISSITVCELTSGIQQIPDQNAQHKKQIQEAFEHFFTGIHVLDYTFASALIYGSLRAKLKITGHDIGAMDCLIASHALAEGRILVTNNLKHFKRIKNLELENWAE
jgi:tRNA(fMet)-specific endonuclease VapC